ncbi:WhiB family transcriptional regulator [Streptomyces krungchingensis]|uniref:WhiB family transcriptional regulator n=1 Tax=Streptomyces krungchingensis TaxID=1565034 RepID=UPI003CF2CCE0
MTTLHELTARTPGLPCRVDPEPFFSDNAREREAAVRACQSCPIRVQCAEYAVENREPAGVWGGTTTANRRTFWSGEPWRFDDEGRLRLVCGTERAYRAHFGHRERPCAECVQAHEVKIAEQRRARLDAEHAGGGSTVGYFLHRRLGEPACEACLAAHVAANKVTRARGGAGRGRPRASAPSKARRAVDTVPGAPAAVHALAVAS